MSLSNPSKGVANLPALQAQEWQAKDLLDWIRFFLPDLIVQEGQAGVLAKQDSG